VQAVVVAVDALLQTVLTDLVLEAAAGAHIQQELLWRLI
jgi:hypothetical protein